MRKLVMCIPLNLRRRFGRAKRRIIKLAQSLAHLVKQTQRVLRSNYPGLLLDANLEDRFARGPFPMPVCETSDVRHLHLKVECRSFHWPRDYPTVGIGWVYREVFAAPEINPHAYEFKDVRMIPGSWVIDAGASEGFFVHYALMRGCKVLALEPDPVFVDALQLTFQTEIAEDKVRIIEGAVGNSTGKAWLKSGESDVFGSCVVGEGGPVRVYTVDELVHAQGIHSLSFIKMDIEGAELHVLKGAQSVLRDLKPTLSIAVYHTEPTASILRNELQKIAPHYRVRFRGAWLRNNDRPRPYLLMASSK